MPAFISSLLVILLSAHSYFDFIKFLEYTKIFSLCASSQSFDSLSLSISLFTSTISPTVFYSLLIQVTSTMRIS